MPSFDAPALLGGPFFRDQQTFQEAHLLGVAGIRQPVLKQRTRRGVRASSNALQWGLGE